MDLFAWAPTYMTKIDSSIIYHHFLTIHWFKLFSQRKLKEKEDRKSAITEEVEKLTCFI